MGESFRLRLLGPLGLVPVDGVEEGGVVVSSDFAGVSDAVDGLALVLDEKNDLSVQNICQI